MSDPSAPPSVEPQFYEYLLNLRFMNVNACAAVAQEDVNEQPLGNPEPRLSRDGIASLDSTEFTGAQVMAFLQRLQDTQEENEELREQVRYLQNLRSEDDGASGAHQAGLEECKAEMHELRRQMQNLNAKLDAERIRYQNAVEQLKNAEAQGKAKSVEISNLQAQLVRLEEMSAKRLEEAIEVLADLDAKTSTLCRAPVQDGDPSLREAHERIHEMQKVIESLKLREEEGKRRERLMEQRNVSLENRLRKGGVAVAEEPVLRYEVQQQNVRPEQQQLIRMQELINDFQQQQLQHHSSQQQQQQREHALETKLHEANVALLVAQQQHQQECRHFQQQIFAAEDSARSSSFSTSQVQGLLEQARDRVRAFEADVRRLEATIHEQEQHIQKQQQQTRAKVFQTIAVQTAYSSPVVLDDQHHVAQSPISSFAATDMPQQVATSCVRISIFYLTRRCRCRCR